jgi:hypothetical protein
MVEHVPLHQNSSKMNKDKNIWAMIHTTWNLAVQKENMLLREIYLLVNSTLKTCALEVILTIGLSLADW